MSARLHPVFASLCLTVLLGSFTWAQPQGNRPDDGPDAQPARQRTGEERTLAQRPPRPRGEDFGPEVEGDNPDQRRPHAGPSSQLSPEEVQEALQIIREYNPEIAERIERWVQNGQEDLGPLIARRLPWVRKLLFVKRTDPPRYELMLSDLKLERACQELSRQLREPEANKADLNAQLKQKVTEQFEVRQKVREMEIAQLEQRVKELREQLEARVKARAELIDRRHGELTGQGGDLPW